MDSDSYKNDACRLCGIGVLSSPIIDLGKTPLANEFLRSKDIQDIFPLQVCVCDKCGHFQLNEIISPERMFRNYLFVSGTSPVNVQHFRQYAEEVINRFNLKPKSKILDIASNDGIFLKRFQELGMSVLGIDPAKNIADEATKNGIPTLPEFFTEQYAHDLVKEYGQFDIVSANNVFAHVPDMIGFAKGVKALLKPQGVFVFEVSYFGDVCDNVVFDTIYHEHMSYHTITPLIHFFRSHGMSVFDVQKLPNHGGSIRVFVAYETSSKYQPEECVEKLCYEEDNIFERAEKLQENIVYLGHKLNQILCDINNAGKKTAIYGVPAKATTLMYALGIDENMIEFAVDDAPLKQGTFTPGKHIQVLPAQSIYEKKLDYLLVLAWNFANPIIAKHKNFSGKWIVPLPNLRIV
jgi:SAM-dependent methyltransferase